MKQKIIKRNGRNFTILEISKKDGFEVEKNSTILIKKNGKEFDEAYLLDQDEKNYFFEGEDKDFIYQVSKNEITIKNNNNNDTSYFSNDENDYNIFSDFSEEESDILQ